MNIFKGIKEDEIKHLLDCTNAVTKSFKKNEIIIHQGQKINSIGYIIKGCVKISRTNFDGSEITVAYAQKDETFAETFALANKQSIVYVTAKEDSCISFINVNKIISTCPKNCTFHKKILENLLRTISSKNLVLQEKIEILSQKSLKDKILMFLQKYKTETNKEIFKLPFSREEIATYLGVNRTALSRELSKLKSEGIIDFEKNLFKIK